MGLKAIEWAHFTKGLQPAEAAALFKNSVATVGLSISSYCNRQCTYCPNVIADRKTARNFMSDALFESILRQLASIDYSDEINITRYNEPLADREYALSRLADIRKHLPKARIALYSNGDYLNRDYLAALEKVGVDSILVTVHAGAGGQTDFAALIAEQDRRIAEYGVPFTFESDNVGDRFRIATGQFGDKMGLAVSAHDFYRGAETGEAWAFDRGGSLPIPKKFRRTAPCLVLFSEMSVEWDGTMLPCCQIHNDVPEHKKYEMGKLTPETDIFLAWTDVSYVKWRVKMFTYDQKEAPCTTCSFGMPMGDDTYFRDTTAQVQKVFRELAGRAATA